MLSSASMSSLLLIRFAPWMTFRNTHPHDLMWPCSLLYGKAIARDAGWQADIVDLHVEPLHEPALLDRMAKRRYNLVLVDTMTPTASLAKATARRLLDAWPQGRFFGIGQHATERSTDLLGSDSPFEGVLLGEWEAALPALLAGDPLPEEKVLVDDVDALPPLSPAGIRMDRYRMRSVTVPDFGVHRWGFLLTSRGCPYPCTFCSATLRQTHGTAFRAQSAERVVDDMLRLYTDFGVNAYYFIDDVFTLKRQRVLDICDLLIRRKSPVRFVVQTRPDLVDPEMCAALKGAGCVAVKMGIESGSPRVLKRIRKNATTSEMLAGARAVKGAGMALTAYYMLGHPDETLDEVAQTRELAREIDADMIQVAFHTPYPGSESWQEFSDLVHDPAKLNHYETQHANPSQIPNEELERLQRRFYLEYYLEPRTLSRYLRRRALYRAADPAEWRLVASTLRYLLGRRGLSGASNA